MCVDILSVVDLVKWKWFVFVCVCLVVVLGSSFSYVSPFRPFPSPLSSVSM